MERTIQQSLARVRQFLIEHPDQARSTDLSATARIESALRVVVEGAGGRRAVTDMPTSLGGGEMTGSPGWLFRAAHAACDASVIAMCAAEAGIELDELEVSVDSESDDRGLLGVGGAPAEPLVTRVRIRLASSSASREQLLSLVDTAELRSPVGQAVRQACRVEVSVGTLETRSR